MRFNKTIGTVFTRRVLVLLALSIVLSALLFFHSNSFEWNTFFESLSAYEPLLLVASGVAVVLAVGEIDISSGGLLSFLAALLLSLDRKHWGKANAFLIVFGVAVAVQLLQFFMVVRGRVPAFLSSLGVSLILFATAEPLLTFSAPGIETTKKLSYLVHPGFFDQSIFGIFVALLVGCALSFSRFGLRFRAVGESKSACLVAGINPHRQILYAYLLSSVLYALAGIHLVARAEANVEPNQGFGIELVAIALVAIAGGRLTGGTLPMFGIGASALFLAILNITAGAFFIFLPGRTYQAPIGLVLIVVVAFDAYFRRRIRQTLGEEVG